VGSPVSRSRASALVRFAGKIREIAAISSDFAGIAARFLRSPDCVAESVGFEPSLPFLSATKSDVCATYRFCNTSPPENLRKHRIQKPAPFLIPPKGEPLAIVGPKVKRFWGPFDGQIGSDVTACVPRSPKANNSPQVCTSKSDKIEIFRDSCKSCCKRPRQPPNTDSYGVRARSYPLRVTGFSLFKRPGLSRP